MNNQSINQGVKIIISGHQSKYAIFLQQRVLQYQTLQLQIFSRIHVNKEDLNVYGCYAIKKIMKMIEISNKDINFLPIIGINVERYDTNYMLLLSMMTPSTITSLRQLIRQINNKEELDPQFLPILHYFRHKVGQFYHNYVQQLTQFQQKCYDFYLIQRNQAYDIVIGLSNIQISKNTIPNKSYLLEELQIILSKDNNYQFTQTLKYPNEYVNSLKIITLAIQQHLHQQYHIINAFLSKYTTNICDFIGESLTYGLTRFVYRNKQAQNSYFNVQSISMINRRNNKVHSGEIYHNLSCKHFQGISQESFLQEQQCPYCGNKLIYDKEHLLNYCQNVFQTLLLCNSLNKNKKNIVYYFREKVFTLIVNQQNHYRERFTNYFHYKIYIQRCKNIYIRNEISLINKYEIIPFHNRLFRPSKFYPLQQLIDCPVRGKFCRHWQFYDLRRVYQKMLISEDEYFECFVCCHDIHFQDIIYLKQMKEIIQLAQECAAPFASNILTNISLNVNHDGQKCELTLKTQGNQGLQVDLDIYQTIQRPLRKSRLDLEVFQSKQIMPSKSFIKFFYGY